MRHTFSLDEEGLTGLMKKSSRPPFSDPWRKVAVSWFEAESRGEEKRRGCRDSAGFLVGVIRLDSE